MRSSGLRARRQNRKLHQLLLFEVHAPLRNMYLCFKAKILSEGKIEKIILWQLNSYKRKQPIFEKIARELQEDVEYIRAFAEKRKNI